MTNEYRWKKADKDRQRLTDKQGKMGRQRLEDADICGKTQKQIHTDKDRQMKTDTFRQTDEE